MRPHHQHHSAMCRRQRTGYRAKGRFGPSPELISGRGVHHHNFIGGAFVDISSKAQLAFDYQEQLASNNGVSSPPPAQLKAYYAHFNVNF